MKCQGVKRLRAESSGVKLTEAEAAIVKGMLERGDRQHDIAAWFGVNGGRIAEIACGRSFNWVQAVKVDLPPRGPYPSGRVSAEAQQTLEEALKSLAAAEASITSLRAATLHRH